MANVAKKTASKKVAAKKPTVAVAPPIDIDTTKDAIYGRLAAIMDQINPIGKDGQNKQQNFKYRGIDQAYNAIHPLLAINRLVTVPRVMGLIGRFTVPNKSGNGTVNYTMLSVEYDFLCNIDGSKVTVGPIFAEGMDSGDKSTAKALASGHKYAIFQLFCIPTSDMPDGDGESHDVVMPQATLMPGATPSLMPLAPQQTTAAPVPVQQQPATASLMPQVAVNTPVAEPQIPAPQPTKKAPKVAQVHPPMEEENNALVIEDEQSATVSADMLINLADMHKGTLVSLQEFWHLNQAVLKILHTSFPSQYQRVAEAFAGHKANLQPQPEG